MFFVLAFFNSLQLASAAASSNAVGGQNCFKYIYFFFSNAYISFGYSCSELATLKSQLEVALERQTELEEENKVIAALSLLLLLLLIFRIIVLLPLTAMLFIRYSLRN